jgi:radical SAM superfamily enzyme YgiQ (UPF0313 family)
MLDAIIISDSGDYTYSVSSSLRLQIDGRPAVIQNIRNYLDNDGKIVDPVRGEYENNWHCAPKLNGICLLSHLQKDGFKVELIDSYYKERFRFIKLLEDNPRAVIISTTFITNKESLYELARDIRTLAKDVYIIAGGPFVYSSYLLLKYSCNVDYDVISPAEDYLFLTENKRPEIDLFIIDKRGEWILSDALRAIKKKSAPATLPNLAWWDGNRYAFSAMSNLSVSSNDIKIDWNNIPNYLFKSGAINVQASYGCPYNCEFCNFIKNKRDTYVKPLDQLIKELKSISCKGVKYVRFVDDNFRLGRKDLNNVCRAFINGGLDLKWMSFIRASALEHADVELLKRAGCTEVQIGIESADQMILTNMNKLADPSMYYRVICKLLEAGIDCSCCFIVGFPGETMETFQRTVDFIESIPKRTQTGSFFWSLYPFLLVPLSPIYEPLKRSRYGLSGYMSTWNHYSMNSNTARQCIIKAFREIKNSSPIYSGDNIEMMDGLPLDRKKEFINIRHALSKFFLDIPYDRSLVINSFLKAL